MGLLVIVGIAAYIAYTIFFGGDKGYDTYKGMLTPTMRFIGAAGYNTYRNADCNGIDVGGMYVCSWSKKHMKKLLKSGWGVKSREDLEATISWLFNEGHNSECMQLMQAYKEDPEKKSIKNKQKKIFEKLCSEYEKQGILAWDLCRVCNVAGWGFLAGYISYKEAIKISVDACKLLQSYYSSWDNMMGSYFCGLAYWNGPSKTSAESRANMYYETRNNEDSIYNISWNTDLSAEDYIMPRTNDSKNIKLLSE